jgi:hypothetical protein
MWSVKKTRTALLSFATLLVSFAAASAQSITQSKTQEREPLLVVRERLRLEPYLADCPERRFVVALSYSVISVFADGRGTKVVWYVPPCSDPAKALEWTAPVDGKIQHFALSPSALVHLQSFLDGPEVKQLRDFFNAGGGVGDYDIEIHRSSGVQRIPILSLMPEHDELKRDPTLLQVICKAKEIAGDKLRPWCPYSPALK